MARREPPSKAKVQVKSYRAKFKVEGRGKVRLLSLQGIDAVSPLSWPLEYPEDQAGFWWELRDKKGEVLYRRGGRSPLTGLVEVFAPGSHSASEYVQVSGQEEIFFLLVPYIKKARSLSIHGSPKGVPEDPAELITKVELWEEVQEGRG